MPVEYYLKLGAGNDQMQGPSRDKHHVGWIKIESFQMSEGQPSRGTQSAPGPSAKPAPPDITLTKFCDESSQALMNVSLSGPPFGSAVIEVVDAVTKLPKLRIDFKGVTIDWTPSGHGTKPMEQMVLHAASMEFNFNPVAED